MTFINPQLRAIRDEVLNCTKCPLYKTRQYPVIGQGNHQASIVLVGEAPGFNENKTGHPFCGQAGKVLDELLETASLKREDIYITNILKCRPPGNRNPLPDEITACTPYLLRQLTAIEPHTIGCLGNFATRFIMEQFGLSERIQGISRIHGQVFTSTFNDRLIKVVPLYHPAVAAYRSDMLDDLKKDFSVLNQNS